MLLKIKGQLLKKENAHLKIVFTDLFPNLSAKKEIESKLEGAIYHDNSIDARNVSAQLKGLRTMFLSFHHFNEKEAKKFIEKGEKAIDKERLDELKAIINRLYSLYKGEVSDKSFDNRTGLV